MLELAPGTGYIHEPFNPEGEPGIGNPDFPWFAYVTRENEEKFYPHIRNILNFRFDIASAVKMLGLEAGRLPREYLAPEIAALENYVDFVKHYADKSCPLVKDPIALLGAEWLASRFDMRVVVMIRHPSAFVSSLKRLGWNFRHSTFLSQPLLMRDYLEPFRGEIEEFASGEPDLVESAALAWKCFYYIVDKYRDKHPDWVFLRHEDISAAPVEGYKDLFQRLNLEYTPQIEGEIRAHSESSNPAEWRQGEYQNVKLDSRAAAVNWKKKLSGTEVGRIRVITGDVAGLFYGDAEW